MNYKEFAQKIKAKYPDYNDMDDQELAQKMVAKFPEYSDVTFEETAASPPATEPVQSAVSVDQKQSGGYLQNIGEYWTKDLPEAGKGLFDRTIDRSKRVEAPTVLGNIAKDATGASGVVGDLVEGTAGIPERLTRLVGGAVGTLGDASGTLFSLGAKAVNNIAGGLPGKALKPVGDKIGEAVKPTAEKITTWYEGLPEADKANLSTSLDLLDALFYESPNVAGTVLKKAGDASTEGGKKVLRSTLKVKDKTAKLAGKNVNEGVEKIVNDVTNFNLQSTTGGIKEIEKKAQEAIDVRKFKNEKILKDYAKQNPTAGVNVTNSLDDLAKNIEAGKVKQIFTNEKEAAEFIGKINEALKLRGLHGYQTIDKLPEIKKVIKDGLDAFSNGKFAIGDAPLKEIVGDLSYLKLTDDIGGHIPKYNAINKEVHDLINVKTAMMEAQKLIGNRNNIGLMDGLALLGSGPALASMGFPQQVIPMAPLVAGVVVGKKVLGNGRGASAMIDAGNVARNVGSKIQKSTPVAGTAAVSVKKNSENKKKRYGALSGMEEE